MLIAFIITSVINTISTELTYGPRSYYNSTERFKDTLKTIQSIKHYVPTAEIYLIEGSKLNHDMEFVFQSLLDVYINTSNNSEITQGINSKMKGYGEALQLKYMFNNYNLEKYDFIFKISGRYYLNENFDLIKLIYSNNVLFCKGKSNNPPIVSTVLYMIPKISFNNIKNVYDIVYKIYKNKDTHYIRGYIAQLHYERIIPEILKDYTIVDSIGVEGLVSSYRTLYKC
jgi:hypothetical protein